MPMDLWKKKTTTAKSAAGTKAAPKRGAKKASVTPEERFRMIEQAAYFRAEKSGFQVDAQANWLASEREVDALLAKRK